MTLCLAAVSLIAIEQLAADNDAYEWHERKAGDGLLLCSRVIVGDAGADADRQLHRRRIHLAVYKAAGGQARPWCRSPPAAVSLLMIGVAI
jgi:hypothetical protein